MVSPNASGRLPSAILTPVFTSQPQVVQPPSQAWGSWPSRERAPQPGRPAGNPQWQSTTAQPTYASNIIAAPPTGTAAAPAQAFRPMTMDTGPQLYQNSPGPSASHPSVANAFNPYGSSGPGFNSAGGPVFPLGLGGPGARPGTGPGGWPSGGPGGGGGPGAAPWGSSGLGLGAPAYSGGPSGSNGGGGPGGHGSSGVHGSRNSEKEVRELDPEEKERLMHCEPGERIVSNTFGEGVLVSTNTRRGSPSDNNQSPMSSHLHVAGGFHPNHNPTSGQSIPRLDANDHYGPPGSANHHPNPNHASHLPRNNSGRPNGVGGPPVGSGGAPNGQPPGAGQHGAPGGPVAPDQNGRIQMTPVTVVDRGASQTLTDHDFPYHDPAYGFGWRYHYTDSLDLQLNEVRVDQKRAPLEELAHAAFLRETEDEWERAHGRSQGDVSTVHRPPGIRRVMEPGSEPEAEGLMGWFFGPEPQRQPGPQQLML